MLIRGPVAVSCDLNIASLHYTEGCQPCAYTLQGQQHTTSEANSTIFPAISRLQLDNRTSGFICVLCCSADHDHAHREGAGGTGLASFPGPQTFKGPHEAFIFTIMGSTLFLYLSNCLDSMSEHLGRIISNAFTVSVDKLFDACKRVESTILPFLHK